MSPNPPEQGDSPADTIGTDVNRLDTQRARFLRGVRLGLPIFLGYAPVGAAFGVLARSHGFTPLEATICSATALAGAGQFIALAVAAGGASVATTLIATAVVNLRYVLFAATLAPRLRGVGRGPLTWLGFTLTDETFAVNVADVRQGESSVGSMTGVGAIAWLGWVLGTLAGSLAAESIGDPSRFGVDFAMPAMFSALFVALAEGPRHVAVGVLAGGIVLALPLTSRMGLHLPPAWFVVVASIAAATVASLVLADD